MSLLCNCLLGALPYTWYTLRYDHPPLCGVKVLPAQNDPTRPPAVMTAKKKKQKKRYPGCLAHAVRGVFYSVVADRRQPNLYIYQVYGRGGVGGGY